MKLLIVILLHTLSIGYFTQSLEMVECDSFDLKNTISCKYEIFYNEDSTYLNIRIIEDGKPLSNYLYSYTRTVGGVIEYYCFSDALSILVNGKSFTIFNPFPNVYKYEEFNSANLCTPNNEFSNLKTISKRGATFSEDITNSSKEYCVFNDSIGTLKRYVQNNVIYKEGYFLKNKKNGTWKYYNNDGKLIKVENYLVGELLSVNLFED